MSRVPARIHPSYFPYLNFTVPTLCRNIPEMPLHYTNYRSRRQSYSVKLGLSMGFDEKVSGSRGVPVKNL